MGARTKNPNTLVIVCDVDPKTVSVNIKEHNHHVPAGVKKSMKAIMDAAEKAAKAQGWYPPLGPLGVKLEFTYNDRRADADNSIKRTIDAVHRALHFDDSKIVEGFWQRKMGEPGMRITLYETVLPEGDNQGGSYRNAPRFVLATPPARKEKKKDE